MKKIQYEAVNAAPVKSFFVSMLTRDIKLEKESAYVPQQ